MRTWQGLTIVLVLGAAAPAQAGTVTFGSDLSRPATLMESFGSDTTFWQRSVPTPGAVLRVPAEGQIKQVRVRGFAASDSEWRVGDPGPFLGGERAVFVQVLEPLDERRVRVRTFGTSQPFYLPGRNQNGTKDTISTFEPKQMCAEPGDFIGFNTVGGFNGVTYPRGTPLHVFAELPGAQMDFDNAVDGTNNGDTLTTEGPRENKELLMEVTLVTGTDAEGGCRAPGETPPAGGGSGPPARRGASIPKQRVTVPKSGKVTVSVFCLDGAQACSGRLRLLNAAGRSFGAQRFTVPPKKTGKIGLKLTAAGFRAITKAGRRGLPIRLVATTTGVTGEVSRPVQMRRR